MRIDSRGEATLTGVVLVGIPMGLIGMGIGASTKTDRWERVQLGLSAVSSLHLDRRYSWYPSLKVAVRVGKSSAR
ncbi:MAG: hypothetical protein U5K69_03145 [Balneolaceae bacterium]|nr:hypothetical protein [Balneolaceae bacterium]